MNYSDVVGIITGGAAGFGLAFSERILSNGGRVLITDVNVEQLEITGKQLAAKYGKSKIAWTYQNVTEWESFHRIFDHAAKFFERPVNLLVNNAGIVGDMSFFNEDASRAWESVITIDLTALMRGTQVGIQQMKKHLNGKEGVIINIASAAGLYPTTYSPEYGAAKHGVVGFTRSCYQLKAQANIRVVGLAPGFAKTAMGRLAEENLPEHIAAMGGVMDVSKVVDAFDLALKDDTNPGRIIRIVMSGHSYYRFAGDKQLYPNAKL